MIKKNTLLFTFLLVGNLLAGQHIVKEGISLDDIELNFSTRYDVNQTYGSNSIDTLTRDCPYVDLCSDLYSELPSIFLPNDGILFQTDLETGEIINRILLYEPFIGTTDNGKLQIGKTTVGDIYELYPDSRLTSTNGKNYWILDNKSISFLTKRFQEDGESPIDSSLILNRKIYLSIIRNTRANNYPYRNKCESPLYAPKNEKHTNCYIDIHKGLIHYLPIGDESAYKRVKHGHWKDFYPNHNIKEEGVYFEGEKHGEFIYYDENGALGETLTHWSKRYLFKILKYFILAIIIIWISIRVRSKIRGKNIK